MRIATWNVNSIRTRIDRVIAFLERSGVDALAMQELKCKDAQFPLEPFEAAGYEVAFHGTNQWNGVAIASRIGISDVELGFPGVPTWGDDAVTEARALGATVGTGTDSLKLDCGGGLGAATHVTGAFAFAAVGRALEMLLKPKA